MVPKKSSLRNLSIKENPTKVLRSEFDKRDKFFQLMEGMFSIRKLSSCVRQSKLRTVLIKLNIETSPTDNFTRNANKSIYT